MKAPVKYIPNLVQDPDRVLAALQKDLEWEQRDAPRREYYCNDFKRPYIYGTGRGQREYLPRPYHPDILAIRTNLEKLCEELYGQESKFEVCFLNRYMNQKDHLGWHADDSPEMDDARPIVTVSLGVEREIWFRPKREPVRVSNISPMGVIAEESVLPIDKLSLEHGSAAIMAPGMQDVWQHRIPKAGFECGERISLTFRGYVVTP